MRSQLLVLSLLIVPFALACAKKKDSDATPQKSVDVDAVKATMTKDLLPKVRDAIPKGFTKKLDLTVGMEADDRVVAVVPSAWKRSVILALEPTEDSFGTQLWISSNCDGMCQSKDWEKVADKVDLDPTRKGDYQILKDEKLDDGHLLIAKGKSAMGDAEVKIVVVRWKKDSSRYFACRADLRGDWAAAQDAFVTACQGMEVVRWGS